MYEQSIRDPGYLKMLVGKWNPILKHMKRTEEKELVAICAENASRALEEQVKNGDTPVGKFARFAMPIVARIVRDLTLSNLVSIQALDRPDGKVFFLDYTYETTKGTITAGDNVADGLDKAYTAGVAKGGNAPKVRLNLTSSAISTTSKKITGEAYVEDLQDLFTYYGVRGEADLVQAMAFQVQREINNYVLNDIITNASAGNVTFDVTVPTTGAYAVIDPKIYEKRVFRAFVDADNLIFKKRSVTPNWVVGSSDFCAYLEKLDDFKADNSPDMNRQAVGLYRLGVFRGRWTVYKYAFMPSSNIGIMGYKGPGRFDTGYVHAPYLMAYLTPAFTDPVTFKTSRGLMSRSGEKLVSGDFYSKITLTNL